MQQAKTATGAAAGAAAAAAKADTLQVEPLLDSQINDLTSNGRNNLDSNRYIKLHINLTDKKC